MHRFTVVRQLGSGAFGRAEQVTDDAGEEYCLKTSTDIESFQKEVDLLEQLVHPNVIRVLDRWDDATTGERFMLMDLCDGSLSDLLQEQKTLGFCFPEDFVLSIFAQLCSATKFVHDNGIMHRDIKCSNVLFVRPSFEDSPLIKLADFGLASSSAESHAVVGTFNNMSPEILKGETYTNKCDVWALGCVLCELANGFPPFGGLSQIYVLKEVLSGATPPIPSSFSCEFHALVSALLQLDPKLRPDMTAIFGMPIVQRGIQLFKG